MAPWADPLPLPLAVVLDGLGEVMTYRLQQVGRNSNPGTMFVPLSMGSATGPLLYYFAFATVRPHFLRSMQDQLPSDPGALGGGAKGI
jgi:hypothetical protein